MRRVVFFLLFLSVPFFLWDPNVGEATTNVASFVERATPYYWASKDTFVLQDLTLQENYGVLIGSNQPTSEHRWVNFTATAMFASVDFRQDTTPVDSSGLTLKTLQLTLYTIDGNFDTSPTELDSLTLSIIYPTDQYSAEELVQNGVVIVGAIFVVTTLLLLVRRIWK